MQGWLREIARVPQALKHAKFWILKAAMAEDSGQTNDAVVDIFEEAFRHKVEVRLSQLTPSVAPPPPVRMDVSKIMLESCVNFIQNVWLMTKT